MAYALRETQIAVTGAGGFLGPVVVDALARAGARVLALIGPPGADARTPAGASLVAKADICDGSALRTFLAGADAVVHLAGPASVSASFQDPSRYVRIHVEGTAALLQACRAQGVAKVVYVSSAEVYGRPLRSPVSEEHPLSARSPYGAAKIGAEKLIEAYVCAFGLRAVVLRPFSVYGPNSSAESLISRIIQLARSGLPVTLRDLKPVRDYCFVSDVAQSIVAACSFQGAALEVFNIGTMRGTSVERVAALILEGLGLSSPIQEGSDRDRPGSSEIFELIADNRRAGDILDWKPAVSLEEGLRMTLVGSEPCRNDI